MAKSKGILLFYDWAAAFGALPPRDCKALLMAMFAFAQEGTPPPAFTGKAAMAAGFIFPALARAGEISAMRSAAGKSGNAVRWRKPDGGADAAEPDRKCGGGESQTIATKQNETKQPDPNPPPLPPDGEADAAEGVCAEQFAQFWERYPKKTARKAAMRVWQALAPDGALVARILAAVDAQRATQAWQLEGGRYIPMAAVWLEGERWNDEVMPQAEPPSGASFDTEEFWQAALTRSYGESEGEDAREGSRG